MSLFEKWRGTITLPPLPEWKRKVGRNTVRQSIFRGATTKAEIFDSQLPGHDLIKTQLEPPYDQLFLRRKKAKRRATELPVLTSTNIVDSDNPPAAFALTWDSADQLIALANDPEKVLNSWANQFRFQQEGETEAELGLRLPQIGALHAIAAHFSVGQAFEPATVVLPTGTGKTETMLAAQAYLRPKRTLVLVSGIALRRQVENKFYTLGILPNCGVFPIELPGLRVAEISGGIRTVTEAQSLLDEANVLIALPNSLDASDPDAIAHLTASCSYLYVDEAHHITARTWRVVRDRFANKRIIQFTATPFRRDGNRVDGKIIFNYKLGDAQAAGYYQKINLKTVEEYGDQDARDEMIAGTAVAALRNDVNQHLDHILMARTGTRNRADALVTLYSRLAPEFRPVVVYSDQPDSENRAALKSLIDRKESGSRIVVCVDMLGEGFDFPNLKIAALHDTHKSLAITLQFIGRFTRKGAKGVGEATVVTNIADPEAESKLAALYAEGADWDLLIRRLSEERIDEELRLQDVISQLREHGDLASQLSLWNLRPAISCQFYKTACAEWSPLKYKDSLPKGAVSWHSLDDKDNLLVAVVSRSEAVDWGNYQNISNALYDLIVVRWDRDRNLLALYASDYDGLRSEQMAKAITYNSADLFCGNAIFNILNNVELPLVKSLGSSRVGAISFTTYFGSNVTEGLGSIDKAEAELSHIACVVYEDGDRVLWGGAKRRGKVWQHRKSTSVVDWVAWTRSTWAKVTSEDEDVSNITKGFLRPQQIDAPYSSYPISAQWGEQAQLIGSEKQIIMFGGLERFLYEVDVEIDSVDADNTPNIRFVSDDMVSIYKLRISRDLSGGYLYERVSGQKALFRRGAKAPEPLEIYLRRDPVIVRYADGTQSYNCYHIPTNLDAGVYPKDQIEEWDFSGIPLNRESIGKGGDTKTIQYRVYQHLEAEYDLIFNDDGHGEAADLVCLKNVDESTIHLSLIHCKGAIGARVSKDIRNFYTVCGQAQKCITRKHGGIARLVGDLKRRENPWRAEGATRFLKGGLKELSFFKEKARKSKIDFEVLLVQPGATVHTVSDDALRLLATTELFLKKTTQANFRVVLGSMDRSQRDLRSVG